MTTMRVDLQGLERQARTVCELGEDLSISTRRWQDALAEPYSTSVRAVRDAWERDFTVYAEVLRAWSEAARASAAAYGETDEHLAGRP